MTSKTENRIEQVCENEGVSESVQKRRTKPQAQQATQAQQDTQVHTSTHKHKHTHKHGTYLTNKLGGNGESEWGGDEDFSAVGGRGQRRKPL